MKKSKVWVIGLDGASFELIKPWVQAGKLPAFSRLEAEGAYGVLSSPIPQSPPAWASFMTGCNPGKHGIYDWIQPRPGSYDADVANGALNKRAALWEILSRRQRRVGVINVPMTYPPKKVSGFLISGYESPYNSHNFTYPHKLRQELKNHFGSYIILPQIVDIPLSRTVENFLETINQREKIMHYLMQKYDPDFFMLVFNAADSMQHLCLQSYKDNRANSAHLAALYSIYKRFDEILQRLLAQLPRETTLIVMSDHGAGPKKKGVLLDHWLAQKGWLNYVPTQNTKSKSINRAKKYQDVASRLKAIVPSSLKSGIRHFLAKQNQRHGHSAVYRSIDWALTRAFTFSSQGVYINLKGRFPQGTVAPGREYNILCNQIATALLALKNPDDGSPVVSQVKKREEMFQGPYSASSPDLYIRWQDQAYQAEITESEPISCIFFTPQLLAMDKNVLSARQENWVGCHRREGIIYMVGEKIQSGQKISGAQIFDLAPTILALMEEAVPSGMDGRMISQALKRKYDSRPSKLSSSDQESSLNDTAPGISQKESEQIIKKLKDMGYL